MGGSDSGGDSSTLGVDEAPMSSRDLNDLAPELQEIAIKFVRDCKLAGLDIVIICTSRSNAEQQAAYDAHLSNARPGESEHNKVNSMGKPASRAFDVGVIRAGKYVGNGSDPDYTKAGAIGEALGLKWAGRWRGRIRETGHFQLP